MQLSRQNNKKRLQNQIIKLLFIYGGFIMRLIEWEVSEDGCEDQA